MSKRKPLAVGEVLVPKDTPKGPREARLAWARALSTQRLVARPEDEDGNTAYLDPSLRCPRKIPADALLKEYERA